MKEAVDDNIGNRPLIDIKSLVSLILWALVILGILALIVAAQKAYSTNPWLNGVVWVLHKINAALSRIVGKFEWVPLVSLSALVALIILAYVFDWVPKLTIPKEILGFSGQMLVIAIIAGFLGSFVRLLNRAVEPSEGNQIAIATMVFNG